MPITLKPTTKSLILLIVLITKILVHVCDVLLLNINLYKNEKIIKYLKSNMTFKKEMIYYPIVVKEKNMGNVSKYIKYTITRNNRILSSKTLEYNHMRRVTRLVHSAISYTLHKINKFSLISQNN